MPILCCGNFMFTLAWALFRSLPWWFWKDQVEDLLICGTCFWQTAASVLNSSFICVWLVHFPHHSCDGNQEIVLVHTGNHLKPYLITPGSGTHTSNGCIITWNSQDSFSLIVLNIYLKNKTLGWQCVCWSFVGPFVVVVVRTNSLNEVAIWTGKKQKNVFTDLLVGDNYLTNHKWLFEIEAFFVHFWKWCAKCLFFCWDVIATSFVNFCVTFFVYKSV